MAQIRKQLERKLGADLKHRGEAHITVITPVEYWQVLKPFLSMEDIYMLAQAEGLQKSQSQILCVGRGRVEMAGQITQTFYLVTPSVALQSFRQKVWQRYVQRGGDPEAFQPAHFYPHITLGFEDRDLHEADGVIKSAETCMENVKLSGVATRE